MDALSRPAPGWNEACRKIAGRLDKEAEEYAEGGALNTSIAIEQMAAIARGMRKEPDHG